MVFGGRRRQGEEEGRAGARMLGRRDGARVSRPFAKTVVQRLWRSAGSGLLHVCVPCVRDAMHLADTYPHVHSTGRSPMMRGLGGMRGE